MTTGKFISQLDALIKKLESVVQSLQGSSFHPSKDQYQTLGGLSLRLTAAATNLPIQIEALKNARTESSAKEGKKFIVQAESDRRDLITTTQLKNRGTFAKNITLFFEGQRDSIVDSDATKARKQVTRERCERICSLSPDGLISWAVAFMATIWTANLMSKDTFDYVFEHIEPDEPLVWPPDIYHILRGLAAEERLRGSHKYHEFLKAAEDDMKKAQSTNQPRKRRRVLDGAAVEGEPLSSVQTSELVAGNPLGQYASSTPMQDREYSSTDMEATQGELRQDNIIKAFKALPFNDRVNTARRLAHLELAPAAKTHIHCISRRLEDKGLLTDPHEEDARPNSILPPNETTTENLEISDNPNSTTTGNAATSASLERVADVFGEYMCRAIRRVTAPSDGILALKAAVTMQFPVFALHDCVMMLEVCEREVEHLVKDLFGIDMTSVMGIRHLILGKGVKLTSNTSNPEITLKGVRDEAIIHVLGPEIHGAITASRMRKRELEEERNHATECVSMIFTSKSSEGAYVNLCLELEGGLRIRDKLYS